MNEDSGRVFVDCPMHGRQLAEYALYPNWWRCPGAFRSNGSGCTTRINDEDRTSEATR